MVHGGLFIGLFMLTVAVAGFVSRVYADDTKIYKSYKIVRKGKSSGGYFIFIQPDGNTEERFSIGKEKYDGFREGDDVELCILRGKLGYDYAIEFNKI
jgi:hypothetical protein